MSLILEERDKFESDILAMRNLHKDTERQFSSFNEIVPYNNNPLDVYSPRLYSILQGASAQTISMMHLLYTEFKRKLNRQEDFPFYYKNLNEKRVLSLQKVSPKEKFDLVLQPFESEIENTPEWWQEYNNTKHDLPLGAYSGKLKNVLNALAALAILHDLADLFMRKANPNKVFDPTNWHDISSEFLIDYKRLENTDLSNGILHTANRGFSRYKSSLFFYLIEYHPKL